MTRRTAKVEELLREEISKLIQAKIPENLGIISVSRVLVTPDLKTAKIYVSAIFIDKEKEILASLKAKVSEFQGLIGKKVKLRYTPRISFEVDHSSDEIGRVEEILEKINSGT